MTIRELPNLMQVRTFVRVAEHGSVSRASVVLFRAQSVITRAIADLEDRLGILLFERRANGMHLTDQGRTILPRAQRVVAELEAVPSLVVEGNCSTVEPLYLFKTRRLQLFTKLCETHHMQTVANLLGLSQPAVSSGLKVLEDGIGQRLFERTPRGLEPTRIASVIRFPIRRALNELRHLDGDIAAMRGTLQGTVRIGALPIGRSRILPEAIARVTAVHPNIRIDTSESVFDQLASDLRAGDLDFIFGALRTSEYATDLEGEELLTEDQILVARSDHPLLQAPVTLEGLRQARLVLPGVGSPTRSMIDACFVSAGLPAPIPVVESASMSIVRGLLLCSDMVATVNRHQLDRDIESGELSILPWPLHNTTRDIGLTVRRSNLPAPAALALMESIRSICRELAKASSNQTTDAEY